MSISEQWKAGDALLAKGSLREAAQCFEAVLAEDPTHKQALQSLGRIALQQGTPARAISLLIKVLERDPGCTHTVQLLWEAYKAQGQEQEMIPLLTHLVQQFPDEPTFRQLLYEAAPAAEHPPAVASSPKTWTMAPAVFDPSLTPKVEALLQEAKTQSQAGRIDLAATTLWRCCTLTRFANIELIQTLARLYQQQQDIPAIQRLWKRTAGAAMERDDLNVFLECAYVSIYAEQMYAQPPSYRYARIDEDLNTYVRLAARHHPLADWVRAHRGQKLHRPGAGGLKVGFVLEGYSRYQAPTQTYLPLAQHHDPEQVELFFYSRHSLGTPLAEKEHYAEMVRLLQDTGAQVWMPAEPLPPMAQVEALTKQIVQDEIDILVYQTTYFVPPYNMTSYLRPAPFQAALEHQQPEFSQALDLVFTTRKAGLDALCNVAPFPMAFTKEPATQPQSRAAFGIPETATVLISANRDVRYAQEAFWQAVVALLDRQPNTYFVALGLAQPPAMLAGHPSVRDRVVTPGFRTDVPACLAAADVYIDLFPSGGGASLVEAMSLGLPVVCFAQDFTTPYAVNSEGLAEYIDDPMLIVPHGDVAAWHQLMDRLIENASLRATLGARMQERARHFTPRHATRTFFDTLTDAYYHNVVLPS